MKKTPGFGRKRERLVGKFENNIDGSGKRPPAGLPLWSSLEHRKKPGSIAIVGAGIAGASLADAFKSRGFDVSLVNTAGQHKASGLPAAILAPRFLLSPSPEREFFAAAYAFTMQHPAFQAAFAEKRGVLYPFIDETAKDRLTKIAQSYAWPEEWMQLTEEGLLLCKGGTVDPNAVLKALTKNVNIIESGVTSIRYHENRWHVFGHSDQKIADFDCIVLAAGTATNQILTRSGLGHENTGVHYPEIRPVIGQIELFDGSSMSEIDEQTLSYGGYVSASLLNDQQQAFRTVGSTFDPMESQNIGAPQVTPNATSRIMAAFKTATGSSTDDLEHLGSWAGLRGTVADHMPYAGPIPVWEDLVEVCQPLAKDAKSELARAPEVHPGLYCLTGLGSKGFQYAPILAEYIASLVTGEPSPLPAKLMAKLHPGRGLVRDIVRKKYRLQ